MNKDIILNQSISLFIMTLLIMSFFVRDYTLTYLFMSTLLFWIALRYSDLNIKVIAGFFFIYYFIPLPNISTYRGTIVYETLVLYTLMILIGLLPILFTIKINKEQKQKQKQKIILGPRFNSVVSIHLTFVYLLLLYVYVKYGFVIINQEQRFKINPIIGYLIKSSIYIPLFSQFVIRGDLKPFTIIKFIILPLLPAIMIGSRGTVILILISVSILFFVTKIPLGNSFKLKSSSVWRKQKKTIKRVLITIVVILHVFYYSRRIFSKKLLSNMEVIQTFFHSNSKLYLLILPLYSSFRETIGIANVLIRNEYKNVVTEYPLFFAELFTILPGKQPAPGQIIGDFIGRNLSGGLTPNLLGGLYPDFGIYSVFGCIVFVIIIKYLYTLSIYNEFYKILYVITLTQFFHLFHRGFLKPEYFIAYIILFIYFSFTKYQNENSPSSLSILA